MELAQEAGVEATPRGRGGGRQPLQLGAVELLRLQPEHSQKVRRAHWTGQSFLSHRHTSGSLLQILQRGVMEQNSPKGGDNVVAVRKGRMVEAGEQGGRVREVEGGGPGLAQAGEGHRAHRVRLEGLGGTGQSWRGQSCRNLRLAV